MIQTITNPAVILPLVRELEKDPCFSSPFFASEKAEKAFEKEDHFVLGAYRGEELTGAFAFLKLEEEKYLESMFLFSKEAAAYNELLEFLAKECPSFEVWFVLNPDNPVLKPLLEEKQACFYTAQRCMKFAGDPPEDPDRVIPFEEAYRQAYIALHSDEGYWSGEKMLEALDRFAVFLYVEDGGLKGYIDLSTGTGTNEIFDILVDPRYRNRGIGKALMKKAILSNGAQPLILTVDVDNAPALHLYESLGFQDVPANSAVTAKLALV